MPEPTVPERGAAERREFIAFVRANHPDVGGDPEVFRAGVEAYRARRQQAEAQRGRVEVHRRRRGPAAVLDALAAARRRRRRPPRVQ